MLAAQPPIANRLKQNKLTANGMVDILRWDDQHESAKFVAMWESQTTATRVLAGVEALALASGLTTRRLWEVLQGAILVQSRESISAQIALAQPKIVAVTIAGALKAKGYSDREHIYKASGFLPTPKGSTVTINTAPQQQQGSAPELEDGDGGDLEPADDELMRASRAMNGGTIKALPAPEIIDAEMDEDDE